MWLFRRRRRPPPERSLSGLQPPPEVGSADYQTPTDLAPGYLFRGDESTAEWLQTRAWVPLGAAPPPDAPPEPIRKDEPMTTDTNPDGVTAGPYGGDNPNEQGPADTRPISLEDSGVHRRPSPHPREPEQDESQPLQAAAYATPDREDCPHCQGTGKVLTKNDLLRASLALLGDNPAQLDAFVVEFYSQLFLHAPYLTSIFPSDLRDPDAKPDGRGKGQRDKLLNALIALGTAYNPDDRKAMEVLDEHLGTFGRSHASFDFPGGARSPSLDEYRLVKVILFNLLHDVTGDKWLPEFDAVWSEAYDYAYRKMGDAAWQFLNERGGEVHPRSVRR